MCLACDTQLNPEDLNAFGEHFLQILNHGALANMIAIGHRTGLFEALRRAGPTTSADLATRANLNERYVREWLGAMTCGGIVEVDTEGKEFHLPATHSAMLTNSGGGDNLAHLAQYVSMMGSVEEPLIECFRNGGGVPYSAFPRFHAVMAADSRQTVVEPLFDKVLPLVPGIALSLHHGINVLDVGCGRGKALLIMAAAYPNSHFTGWDLNEDAISQARAEAQDLGLTNLTFNARDLSDFHLTAPDQVFDFITAFDAIHDQARPDHVLAGIRHALKADGVFLMQDIGASSNVAENRDHPIGTLLYSLSCAHCMTVSLAQGGLGVGAMWGEALTLQFLKEAGFAHIDRHTLDHDIQNYYYIIRP
jgi:ubiquinone/menaquinone biosynthesis C-methylase UbiE